MSATPRTDAMTEKHPSWPATACEWARTLERDSAATPELLAALEHIATQAGITAITFPNAPGNEDLQGIVRTARAAIAKARGGVQ